MYVRDQIKYNICIGPIIRLTENDFFIIVWWNPKIYEKEGRAKGK